MTQLLTEDPDYAIFCQQKLQNPYPFFARLRREDPVHYCDPMHMWLVASYDDAQACLKDPARLPSGRRGMYLDPLREENRASAIPLVERIDLWLQNTNPPDHTRMRRLVSLVFTPRMIERLVPKIESIVDAAIEGIRRAGRVDFVKALSFPLPSTVICEMLGIPESDHDRYRKDLDDLSPFNSGAGPALNDAIPTARAAMDDLLGLVDDLIEERRRHPKDDLISAMVEASSDDDRLSREEVFALCMFLYVAGHETTMGLLSAGTWLLLTHPDQFELLKSDPDGLVAPAVEEFLRYESPVARAVRVAAEDTEIGGRTVLAGQTVMMLIGAANRDPRVFDDPERLDITRQPNPHLGFGHGIHFCIGAALARLEAHVAFKAIATRLPDLKLDADEIGWRPTLGTRSIEALPVRVEG
jgi:pimeloyl-[acyl-carrier protein] synthase